MGKFLILCDFVILGTDEDLPVPLILGRIFLATAGVVIDVPTGTMSFTMYGERVNFCFPSPAPLLTSGTQFAPVVPPLSSPPLTMSRVESTDCSGRPRMRTTVLPSPSPLTTPHFRGPTWEDNTSWEAPMTDFYLGEVLDVPSFHIFHHLTPPRPIVISFLR